MHLPATVVQLLFAIQLPVCLYVGCPHGQAHRARRAQLARLRLPHRHRLPAAGRHDRARGLLRVPAGPARRRRASAARSAASRRDVTPYVLSGRRCLTVDGDCRVRRAEPAARPRRPAGGRRDAALDAPLDAPPLAELARGARSVAVVVPDATRDCPVADAAAARCSTASRRPACATNRCASWSAAACIARPPPDEKAALVGAPVAARLRVVDAQGISQTSVALGDRAGGGAISMNDAVARADLVIAVGIVEPHLYAGFSGGVEGGGDRLRRPGDDRLDTPPRLSRPARRAALPARRQSVSGGAARDRGAPPRCGSR